MTQHRDLSRNQQGQDVALLHNHLLTLSFNMSTTKTINELCGQTSILKKG